MYWSPSTQTALAEAELEYIEDYVSRSVYVRFPLVQLSIPLQQQLAHASLSASSPSSHAELLRRASEGAIPIDAVVWTTTPWSLPSNMAAAVNPELDYSLVVRAASPEDARLMLIGSDLVQRISELPMGPHRTRKAGSAPPTQEDAAEEVGPLTELARIKGADLVGSRYTHHFISNIRGNADASVSSGAEPSRPIVGADYVTADAGTGIVHTAPAHGAEDYEMMKAHGLLAAEEPFSPIDDQGRYTSDVPRASELQGLPVLDEGARAVVGLLDRAGLLLAELPHRHRYPCDWRSKQPVVVRATWQWFADLGAIKRDALAALDHVRFTPPATRNRLVAFVKGRSEWCISRQRAWGLPIPVLYDEASGEPLLNLENVKHIANVLKDKGMDHWWIGEADEFVADRFKQEGKVWRKGTDTIDVWFDSGSSWSTIAGLLEQEGLDVETSGSPVADVYLEGSDQHRGWFQSSLLTRIATCAEGAPRQAPYRDVITHGMVVDKDGKKMSKSIGNVISPLEFIHGNPKTGIPAYGTDVLRLWVARSDYTRESPVGIEIMKKASDALRKLRNTARFMLANLGAEAPAPLDKVQLDLVSIRRVCSQLPSSLN